MEDIYVLRLDIFNELALRVESVEIPHQERYNLSEDEDAGLLDTDTRL